MSLHVVESVTCDACGEEGPIQLSRDHPDWVPNLLRGVLQRRGWKRRGDGDLCPQCVKVERWTGESVMRAKLVRKRKRKGG